MLSLITCSLNNGVIVSVDIRPTPFFHPPSNHLLLLAYFSLSLSFRNPLAENFLSVTPFHRLSRSLSSSRSKFSSPLSWSATLLGPLFADACRCHYGRVREDGGRRTFKSTPPQSNYRPGHDDAHALFMADAACLLHAHTCTREQRETEKRTAGGWAPFRRG